MKFTDGKHILSNTSKVDESGVILFFGDVLEFSSIYPRMPEIIVGGGKFISNTLLDTDYFSQTGGSVMGRGQSLNILSTS